MNVQKSLLSLAIASGLAVVAMPAAAAGKLNSAAASRASALIGGHAAAVRRADADAFAARDVVVDRNGTEHVRFERTYRGLPVIGGDFVVHSRNGKLSGVSQTLKTSARPALQARVSRDQAIVEAGARFGSRFSGAPSARTVVYARGATPVLAHEVVFNGIKADQTPTEMHYFVDARSGKILDQWDTVQTARPGPGGGSSCTATAKVGSGMSLTEGTVAIDTSLCNGTYQMVDLTRGGGATHNLAMKTSGMLWVAPACSATRRPWRSTPITACRPPGTTTRRSMAAAASPTTARARSAASTTAATTPTPSGATAASA